MTPRTLRHLDDADCALRARQGDGSAYAELVARYQDRIYRFLLRLTRSRDDALDIAQETFLRAYQGLPGWQPRAPFAAWLFRIARNLAFDLLRRHQRVEFVALDDDADVADSAPTPDAALAATQRVGQLEAALARLPLEQREALLLREIEALSYEDIAGVLDVQLGTVKSRIARARAALLASLPPHEENLP